MSIPDSTPTHQSICYDPSSSTWSLAYHCIHRMVSTDRINKGASFVIKPLTIAGISCTRQLRDIRLTSADNRTNGYYSSTVISLSYGSVSIQRILVTYVSASMLDFSNYLFQQHHSLLRLSSWECGV